MPQDFLSQLSTMSMTWRAPRQPRRLDPTPESPVCRVGGRGRHRTLSKPPQVPPTAAPGLSGAAAPTANRLGSCPGPWAHPPSCRNRPEPGPPLSPRCFSLSGHRHTDLRGAGLPGVLAAATQAGHSGLSSCDSACLRSEWTNEWTAALAVRTGTSLFPLLVPRSRPEHAVGAQ